MVEIPILEQLEYILRVVIAAICGGLIGFERERRVKSAGLKTHIIVGIGAALMMVISKYGFFDLLADPNLSEKVKLDPSRVASGIVAAVGFLGSGIIFVKNFKTNGVTTAAGLWATVGVGMAFGSGMYLIGAVVSLFDSADSVSFPSTLENFSVLFLSAFRSSSPRLGRGIVVLWSTN